MNFGPSSWEIVASVVKKRFRINVRLYGRKYVASRQKVPALIRFCANCSSRRMSSLLAMVYLLCSGDVGIICHVVIGHFSTSGDKVATSPRPALTNLILAMPSLRGSGHITHSGMTHRLAQLVMRTNVTVPFLLRCGRWCRTPSVLKFFRPASPRGLQVIPRFQVQNLNV